MPKDEEKLTEELEKLVIEEKEEDWFNEEKDQGYNIEFSNFPATTQQVEVFLFLNKNPDAHPISEDDVVNIELSPETPGAGIITFNNEIAFAIGMSMDKLHYKQNQIQIRSLETPEVTEMVIKRVVIPAKTSTSKPHFANAKPAETPRPAARPSAAGSRRAPQGHGHREKPNTAAQQRASPDRRPGHSQYRRQHGGPPQASPAPDRRPQGHGAEARAPRPNAKAQGQADAKLEEERRVWSSKNGQREPKRFVALNEKIAEKESAPRLKFNFEDFVKPAEKRADIFGSGKSRDDIRKEREAKEKGAGAGVGAVAKEKPRTGGYNKFANLGNVQ